MDKNRVYFAPYINAASVSASAASELGLGFTDKRNRNPNWTDHEIIRFLDILQEEKVLKDLMAQRNKQVIFARFAFEFSRQKIEGQNRAQHK